MRAAHSPFLFLALGMLGLAIAWGVLILSVLLHEVGHAAAARMNGYTITSLGIGTGKPLLRLRLGGTLLYLCGLRHGLLGLTWVYAAEPFPRRSRQLSVLLGGAAANGIFAGISLLTLTWLLPRYPVPPLFSVLALTTALINSGMGLATALPLRLPQRGSESLASDGRQALALLLKGPRPGSNVFLPPQRHLRWRALWDAIGDNEALTVHLLNAAGEYEEIGAAEAAIRCIEEAERLRITAPTALYRDAWLSLLRVRLGRSMAASELARADRAFTELSSPGGRLLVRRERVRHQEKRSWEERDMETAQLAEDPLAQENPALLLRLLADRLVALQNAVGAADTDLRPLVELLSSRYESVRQRTPSPKAIDRIAFGAMAVLRRRLGDGAGAQIAEYRAREAARAIYEALADDPDAQREFADLTRPYQAQT